MRGESIMGGAILRGLQPDDTAAWRKSIGPVRWRSYDWGDIGTGGGNRSGFTCEKPCSTLTVRHSWITTALTSGMSTLDVARLVGTSLLMIEKHYGHLVSDAARLRLANVEML